MTYTAAGTTPRTAHWVRNPITTRHSQAGLLTVSLTWGLSYCMPENLRIPFSEVFPISLHHWSSIPMWGWGLALLSAALLALVGERLILTALVSGNMRTMGRAGWRTSIFAHTVLCSVYFTLAVAALVTGVRESHWDAAGLISATSRPVLWGYLSWLHLTYARLPKPYNTPVKRKKGRIRLFVRETVDDDDSG